MADKDYIGDAVYVERQIHEEGDLVLTTSDGISDTNRIYLEPEVLAALLRYICRHWRIVITNAKQL